MDYKDFLSDVKNIFCSILCKAFIDCITKVFLSILLIPGKPFYQNEEQTEESGGFLDGNNLQIGSPARSSPHSQGSDNGERFSRKVFVGGLPPDIDEGKLNK